MASWDHAYDAETYWMFSKHTTADLPFMSNRIQSELSVKVRMTKLSQKTPSDAAPAPFRHTHSQNHAVWASMGIFDCHLERVGAKSKEARPL